MSRMDKYTEFDETEEKQDESPVLSRVSKNQIIYDDVYMNSKMVDINSVIEGEEAPISKEEEPEQTQKEEYQEKSYDVNEYLSKAHENKKEDNLKREINSNEFKEQEDEIRRLIASINEKEDEEDFFVNLKGDNEDTLIGAKFNKTDEFDDSIYETLVGEKFLEGNTILDHALGDNTVLGLEKEEDEKIDHTFEKIMKDDILLSKKNKKLPIIIFSITTFILIVVIIIILLVR